MNTFPQIRIMGLSGVLIRFADRLSEPANRAALACRAAIEAEAWPGVVETTTALASTFLRIDPLAADPRELAERAEALAQARDWLAEPLPQGRRLWKIPCAWGGPLAPDLEDAAAAAGLDPEAAMQLLANCRTRVLTLGFAPGQPYLGDLPEPFDLPRRSQLQEAAQGSILLAVRQLILFTAKSPTGWRVVGQTAFRNFRPETAQPIALSPGDELMFPAADPDLISERLARGDSDTGVEIEALP